MPDEILQKYITVHPNRTVSLSEFSFFKLAFAFADQNPPGSGTFEFVRWPFLELKTFFYILWSKIVFSVVDWN